MSFLDELQSKKRLLKPTVTTITHADGSKTIKDGEMEHKLERSFNTYGFVIDTKPDTIPACIITDFLYLGSQDSVDSDNISKYNITDIISVGIEAPGSHLDNITYHTIPCLDLPTTEVKPHIEEAVTIIDKIRELNGSVLVHCNAGVSRSATICIGYLMIRQKLNFLDAYNFVKSKRECIRPNDGFIHQLKLLDINL